MRYVFMFIGLAAVIFYINGCVIPFSPPEVNSDEKYLVVDGFLNVSQDTSKIELRRTQNANETATPTIESGALITVESESGQIFTFKEKGKGVYLLGPQTYNQSVKYRLNIKTVNGNTYASDYVVVNQTPPIDSIGYKVDTRQDAMVFYVNAHDDKMKTRFYRWKVEETWAYRAPYYSSLEVVGKGDDRKIVDRKDDINLCYQSRSSSSILLGSTIKLSKDIIKDLPINLVPISTNKLYVKYSIVVKQYGLSQEAFEYWTSLSKTTQSTGSLFDPQPSQVTGNIKNTKNPKELIFGFFSTVAEQKKRIFISPGLGRYPGCTETDTVHNTICPGYTNDCGIKTEKLLLSYFGARSDSVIIAYPSCADCRLLGGTTQRPAFWE